MITRVAVKHEGIVYVGAEGKRHDSVIQNMVNHNLNNLHTSINGFIDDKGNFLNRKDAAKHAFECGQLPNDKTCPDCILSEDLW
jgi:hypothetical protein